MSQLRWKSKTNIFLSKIASKVTWEEQLGSGSKPSSSEDLRESPQSQEASTPGGFQKNEEVLSSPASTVTLSHHESQLFTQLHMVKMEKMFEDDVDSTGALDMKTFIKAIKKILSNASDEMLEALFLKVDTDCNGSITWQEYVDYVMRELQRRERMRTSQYRLHFHLPMRIIPLNHGCEIVKVQFLTQRFKKMGHLLTVTKDGILQIWSESFSLLNSFRLNQIHQPYNQQMWVTDMVCLHNMNLIAIASTDQKIEFFDITNHNCARAFTFIDLDSCVLTMDYWSDYHRGVFCYGDTKGNVIVFTSDNVTHGLFNPRILPRTSKWDHWTKVSTRKLLNEKSPLYRSYWLKALHPNWCQQVKFIPQLNTVASCSAIEKSSLVLIALPSKAPESPKFSVLNLRKGILCFDYCPDKNLVVTGGYDPLIRLWNPFFSKKPVWMMKGHQTSVTHILVNSKNSSILLSISKDKNIRVWDMQDYICLQSFSGKLFALGNCPITSVYFHKNEDSLICSTFSIGILKGYLETEGPGKPRERTTTYSTPLCAVLYSKIFKQVVSGCLSSLVSVWEIKTGKRMMEFSVTGDQQVELTTMCLDESERCLLTGLRDGTIKMWNYTVGECLLTFPNPDQLEISGIVHMNKVFYVTGWSKRITCFMLHKTKPVLLCYQWQSFHKEDVLSMAKYQNQFLGTSSYNGDILFWNINLFKPILNFNASKSPWPLLPKKIQEVDNSLAESLQSSKLCVKHKEWAYKPSTQPLGPRARAVANANLQRNLMSAPPVMKRPRDKEPEKPMPPQVGAEGRETLPHHDDLGGPFFFPETCQFTKPQAVKNAPWQTVHHQRRSKEKRGIPEEDTTAIQHIGGEGTFGVSVWKGLQDIQTVGDLALRKSSEEEADSIDAAQKAFRPELQEERALAEALVYQRREQVALMALLNGKADAEAEAWGKLQRITQMSPWAGEHYSEDVEHSWLEWESKGKQVSKIVGGAYKAKDRSRSPGVLSTNVQYGWMKHQISPQIYQSLHFNQLSPTHTPDFLVHNILGHHGQHIYLVTHNSQKDLDPEETNSSTASVSPSDTLTPKASGSGFLESALSTSPYLQPSLSLLSQPSRYVTQRSAPPMPVASSIKLLSRPLKAALSSSMKKSHGVRF
ncbi:EF-hand calcium-binding domain-containing protein 8 isoform X11 [Canis lupus baileyi]|uniref:EF-hand calcium-binding domain-containing protein 8 isoform X10 n=1 Tax=Canis lupus familiaris TaxID=9615 RepID=UPI000BAA09B3|nr:EF-hand calcium-binding domain-containing protein 8 isoform X10 [Canis lupus familiaris]XP_038427921.1 EF-hand calcium-binding domain-containing protein 8 isoform X10 [Canis lupus familiaris]|eukprot:XP_022264617.1 EF-hand calcium-binding domain-containing protein 8 isoform X10 [Canis lupus familiaris]